MQEKSLAQFIQETRDALGMSASGLAKKSHLNLSIIEEIESGQELFLSTTTRQILSKALKCEPDEIKKYEKNFDTKFASQESIEFLKENILNGETDLICPKCGSKLIVRIAKMYDLEDNMVLHPKARCSKCVFQIKD